MAKQYEAFSADHETLGSVIIPYRDSVNAGNYITLYEKHGLSNLDPSAWYPMQSLLDVFNDMGHTRFSSTMDFVSLGMEMSKQLKLPAESANMSFIDMVASVNAIYNFNNRGSAPGYIRGHMENDNHAVFEYYTPFPDDLLYGSLYGYAKRFLPNGTDFIVAYDQDIPRREQGGEVTIIHVTW